MKVNLFVEFNREKYNLTTTLIFTKVKLWHKLLQTPT